MNRIFRLSRTFLTVVLFLLTILLTIAPAQTAQSPHSAMMTSGYLPNRVYWSDESKFTDFEVMLSQAARSDALFIGEFHNDPMTHRVELAVLEGIARRRPNVVLSLEMFERDVQGALNDYLAGKITLDQFIAASRPWGNYATDYHPLVAFAQAKGWRVVAANIPRPYASKVGKEGLAALDSLSPTDRKQAAQENQCPKDDYFTRFSAVMSGGAGHPGAEKAKTEDEKKAEAERLDRFYAAQCVKDETMAESIAEVLATSVDPKPLVIHVNGAFHSDFHLGTVARVARRLPKARLTTISCLPVDDLDSVDGRERKQQADFLVFVLGPKK